MAQTQERQQKNTALASSSAATGASETAKSTPRLGFLNFLRGNPSATSANGQRPAKATTGMGRFLFGFLILMLLAQVMQIGISLLNVNMHLNLERPFGDSSTPIIGGLHLSYLAVLYIVLLFGLYILLLRLKIIPSDPLGSKARMQANARAAQESRPSGTTTRSASSATAVNLQPRTRAARRETTRAAEAAAAAKAAAAASKKKGWGRTSAKAKSAPPPVSTKIAQPAGSHDDAYERVRAEQRLRRRREAKR